MNKEEKKLQKRGPAAHAARMTIRKFHRDRRTEPPLTRKRADMMISAWGASEYARHYGVGLKKHLTEKHDED